MLDAQHIVHLHDGYYLISFAGAIKLVDFGIARVETVATPRTASGNIKGKIPYMSPEQCRGRPLDGRSDLFSLGVVLYELTTNCRPFDRDSEFAIRHRPKILLPRGSFNGRLAKCAPFEQGHLPQPRQGRKTPHD